MKKKDKNVISNNRKVSLVAEKIIDTKEIIKILEDSYYQRSMQNVENSDVTINHLENIFTNETYYLAMKIVPLLERKVLYLSFIENVRLNDICKRLKLQKHEVISLRNKGIEHFKYNLKTLYKAKSIKKGGNV